MKGKSMSTKLRVELHEDYADSLTHSLYVHTRTRVPGYLHEELGEMDLLGSRTNEVLVGYKGVIYIAEYEDFHPYDPFGISFNSCRLIIREFPETINVLMVEDYDRSVITKAAKIIAGRYLDDHPELLYK
jgi:hypothetical protein